MNQIYLSLGSNLGNRLMNLQRAVVSLSRFCPVTAVSPIYQTSPWGVEEQPAFLNMCVAATTTETPHGLLTHLKYLEAAMGRQATYQWGPRVIDIDILFYNDWIINDEQLIIPHTHIAERAFVLVPLADIAPNLYHPQLQLTITQLLQQVDTYTVTPFAEMPLLTALEN
ncbi:MAG: 2-amino-4-hydroxy-6-hydroxymethyldihydropteridine diphosphokinase [Chloroflexota bacterium]